MVAIFDFPLLLTSHNIRIAAIVFLDPEKMGITVEISLISCVHAEVKILIFYASRNVEGTSTFTCVSWCGVGP